jgi:hypothetical protein
MHFSVIFLSYLLFDISKNKEVLGSTSRAPEATGTAQKTMRPTILLLLRVY